MAGIIWLASYPKSGNTWVRMFFENLFADAAEPQSINAPKTFTLAEANWHWYRRVTTRKVEELTADEISLLRRRVHKLLTRTGTGNVIVKTHSALMDRLGVPLITPAYTAGAIYIVRNPLDVAPSFAKHFDCTLDQAIRRMKTQETRLGPSALQTYDWPGSWSFNVESWTARPHPGLLVVRYEDLLQDPESHFRKIARHVGQDVAEEKLARAIAFSSFKELRGQEEKHGFIEASEKAAGFFNKGQAGGWRELLSSAQVERIRRAHKKTMARFAYL